MWTPSTSDDIKNNKFDSPGKRELYINTNFKSHSASPSPTNLTPKEKPSPSPKPPTPKSPSPEVPTIDFNNFVPFVNDVSSYRLSDDDKSMDLFRIWNDASVPFWGTVEKDIRVSAVSGIFTVFAPNVSSGWNGISLYSNEKEMLKNYRNSSSSTSYYKCSSSIILSFGGIQLLQDPNNSFHFGLSPLEDMPLNVFYAKLDQIFPKFRLASSSSLPPTLEGKKED